MPNGIDLILADHRLVDELFERFEDQPDGNVVGVVLDSLSAHDDVEHGALYPLAETILADADLLVRCTAAHAAVKKQIDMVKQLEGTPLVDAFRALRVLVTEHVGDEETNLLPALAERATPQQLEGLGARILQIKQRVG